MLSPKEIAKSPQIDLVIRWIPATGQIQIAWPNVDDLVKLGLLEMAKVALSEQRQYQREHPIAAANTIPRMQ